MKIKQKLLNFFHIVNFGEISAVMVATPSILVSFSGSFVLTEIFWRRAESTRKKTGRIDNTIKTTKSPIFRSVYARTIGLNWNWLKKLKIHSKNATHNEAQHPWLNYVSE